MKPLSNYQASAHGTRVTVDSSPCCKPLKRVLDDVNGLSGEIIGFRTNTLQPFPNDNVHVRLEFADGVKEERWFFARELRIENGTWLARGHLLYGRKAHTRPPKRMEVQPNA